MKLLITGYKGFIGSVALEVMQDRCDVVTYEWGEDFPDISDCSHAWHFGAISSTAEQDVERVMHQNYDFSLFLLTECNNYGINLQYSSSASIYGLGTNFSEDAPPDPRTPYAWSKYLFDREVQTYLDQGVLNITVQGFRYFNVYGYHGESHKDQPSPFYRFREQARQEGVIQVFDGSEDFKRDFIHVDDVIDYHLKFLNIPESGIWNIGSGKATSFLDIAESVARKEHAKIETIPMPQHTKRSYQEYTCADLTKLGNTLALYMQQ
jgi:ADP-L-glycero-D-manno-heptose 6-epimerase